MKLFNELSTGKVRYHESIDERWRRKKFSMPLSDSDRAVNGLPCVYRTPIDLPHPAAVVTCRGKSGDTRPLAQRIILRRGRL